MEVSKTFLINNITVFEGLGYTFLGLAIIHLLSLSYNNSTTKRLSIHSPIIYFVLIGLALFFSRVTSLLYNIELNVDESQYIASAMTLQEKIVPWKHIDPTTAGPLHIYALMLISWCNFTLNFMSARILGLLLLYTSVITFFYSLKNFFSPYAAKFGVFIVSLVFFTSGGAYNLTHYNSELVSVMLLNFAFLGISLFWKAKEHINYTRVFFTGVALGALAFAKLQSAPVGLVLTGVCFFIFWKAKEKASTWIAFTLGGISVPLFFLCFLGYHDAFSEFWNFYILANIDHADHGYYRVSDSYWKVIIHWMVCFYTSHLKVILLIFIIPLVFCALTMNRSYRKQYHYNFSSRLLSSSYLWVSLYVILKPGCLFSHYLMFLAFPLCFSILHFLNRKKLLASNAYFSQKHLNIFKDTISMKKITVLMIIISSVTGLTYSKSLEDIRLWGFELEDPNKDKVIDFVNTQLEEDREIYVWGYSPRIYVDTQSTVATPLVHNYDLISRNHLEGIGKYYYDTLLSHLQQNKPVLFIAFHQYPNFIPSKRFEAYPEITDFVNTHYTFIKAFNYVHDCKVECRIYKLKTAITSEVFNEKLSVLK